MPELAFGIGIHHGIAVVGVIGSDELLEFAIIGDVVNVAARVETLTRRFKTDILVTEDVQKELDSRYITDELPAAEVKGKKEPVVTYAVRTVVREERAD